jgi:hypothetical protein
VNVYGGAGDDDIVFKPGLNLPLYVDGGGGFNSVTGWPTNIDNVPHGMTRKVDGVFVHGQKGSPAHYDRVQVIRGGGTVPVFAAHGLHSVAAPGTALTTGTTTTGELSQTHSGVAAQVMFAGGNLMNAMGTLHGGGVISPELMARVSVNTQVGGQVAYHKPG